MSFYDDGPGDRLVDDATYPNEIREFLRREEDLLLSAKSSYDLLVEVGCMHGRYLNWALDHDKAYVGIDIVPRYIELGATEANELRLPSNRCQFILGDAGIIDTLVDPTLLGTDRSRMLLFFPFNSFGNMPTCAPIIKAVKQSLAPFLISTYTTSTSSTASRRHYYGACSYTGLGATENEEGVLFTANDGLSSIAYHLEFIFNVFASASLPVEATRFGQIGIAYTTPGLFRNV